MYTSMQSRKFDLEFFAHEIQAFPPHLFQTLVISIISSLNGIGEDKKAAILLSVIGLKTYGGAEESSGAF